MGKSQVFPDLTEIDSKTIVTKVGTWNNWCRC